MATYKQVMPVLRVTDLDRSLAFYVDLLGLKVLWRAEGGDGENCMLQSGGITLMISTGSHLGKKPGFSGTFYFTMTGVKALHERIKDHVEFSWPLEEMEYGTLEFGVKDPDGYLIGLTEDTGK